MKITDIILKEENIFRSDVILVVEQYPLYEYQNGVKTNKVIGYRYGVVAPYAGYEKFIIKVVDMMPLFPNSNGLLEKPCQVEFKNFEARFYYSREKQDYLLTAKADNIFVKGETEHGK